MVLSRRYAENPQAAGRRSFPGCSLEGCADAMSGCAATVSAFIPSLTLSYFQVYGSVIPRSLPMAMIGAIEGALIKAAFFWGWDFLGVGHKDAWLDPYSLSAIAAALSVALVMRTKVAYGRFWEGAMECHQLTAKWADAAMQVFAFDELSADAYTDDALEFRFLFCHYISLIHACTMIHLRKDDDVTTELTLNSEDPYLYRIRHSDNVRAKRRSASGKTVPEKDEEGKEPAIKLASKWLERSRSGKLAMAARRASCMRPACGIGFRRASVAPGTKAEAELMATNKCTGSLATVARRTSCGISLRRASVAPGAKVLSACSPTAAAPSGKDSPHCSCCRSSCHTPVNASPRHAPLTRRGVSFTGSTDEDVNYSVAYACACASPSAAALSAAAAAAAFAHAENSSTTGECCCVAGLGAAPPPNRTSSSSDDGGRGPVSGSSIAARGSSAIEGGQSKEGGLFSSRGALLAERRSHRMPDRAWRSSISASSASGLSSADKTSRTSVPLSRVLWMRKLLQATARYSLRTASHHALPHHYPVLSFCITLHRIASHFIPPHALPSNHNIPSHDTPPHPTPSYAILSHPIPSDSIQSYPNPIQSNPIQSNPT